LVISAEKGKRGAFLLSASSTKQEYEGEGDDDQRDERAKFLRRKYYHQCGQHTLARELLSIAAAPPNR
jgi:hypothetical protein